MKVRVWAKLFSRRPDSFAEKLEGSTNPHETGTKNQSTIHLILCDFVDHALVFIDFQQLLKVELYSMVGAHYTR